MVYSFHIKEGIGCEYQTLRTCIHIDTEVKHSESQDTIKIGLGIYSRPE